ncbi:MAG: hypothetical protein COB53_03615 [Elusimicrobia bacterium]|nr:MAG: hypothetical protein COB53_03615 [Elusimicrobiota bacterium]
MRIKTFAGWEESPALQCSDIWLHTKHLPKKKNMHWIVWDPSKPEDILGLMVTVQSTIGLKLEAQSGKIFYPSHNKIHTYHPASNGIRAFLSLDCDNNIQELWISPDGN